MQLRFEIGKGSVKPCDLSHEWSRHDVMGNLWAHQSPTTFEVHRNLHCDLRSCFANLHRPVQAKSGKRRFESKSPHVYTGHHRERGISRLEGPFSGVDFGRKHPSRDVIFAAKIWPKNAKKILSRDVLDFGIT